MAFHEKAGRSQVDACLFLLGTFCSSAEWPLGYPLFLLSSELGLYS
jgi:hypothetical protein